MDRLGGLLLLVLGLASAWFALVGKYEVLMNPTYRWVTIAGAALVLPMGLALVWKPAGGSTSALVIFGLFLVLLGLARPQEGGVAPLAAPLHGPALERAGYAPVGLQSLFQSLDQEAPGLERPQAAIRGVVKRLPELDAEDAFVLLEPMITCCLADAVAFGVRVHHPAGPLPEDGSWQYAFGDLLPLDPPVVTPAFRLGAIAFTPVSRRHRFAAHEVVSVQALLEDLFERTPEEFTTTYRRLATESGVEDTLREEGPFTLFALHDAAFEAMPAQGREALLGDADAVRRLLEGLIVPGRYAELDLFDAPVLTTLAGTKIRIRMENGRIRVGGARVLLGPLEARNGLVYVVHPAPASDDD